MLQFTSHSFLAVVITFKVVKRLLKKLKVRHKGMAIVDKLTFSCLEKMCSRLSGLISHEEELSSLTADLPTQAYGTVD